MKPSRRRHRALYNGHDDDHHDNNSVSSSGSVNPDHQQQSDGGDGARPEALHRLQRKLTTAMEHMERAQLEFFHVERAFQENKQQQEECKQQKQYKDKQSVPWCLKVLLYCDFWQQFVVQLRSALRGGRDDNGDDGDGSDAYNDESNERAIQSLSVLASNVWGETRTPTQEVFHNGPVVLTPRTRRLPLVHQQQHKHQVAGQQSSTTAVAFSEIGPYQDVTQWASKGKPAVHSLKSLMSIPATAAASKTTTTTGKANSNSNGKAAAHTIAGRPQKKAKTSVGKESGTTGNGTADKVTGAVAGVNGAKQSSAFYGPSNGVQSITTKPNATEASSSTQAAKSPAKTRPDARKPTDMIGLIDRLLADRGLSPNATNQLSLTRSSPASITQLPQRQRNKKLTASLAAHKLVPVALAEKEGDGDQAALQLVPISESTSDVDESLVQIKAEIAYNGNGGVTNQAKKTKVMRGARRYAFNERLGQRIQDQLGANEVFPDIHISLPREHFMFDPTEHPLLVKEHELFWQKGTATYLDMVYYHPTAGDHGRIGQSKKRLLCRQRELLSKYIETLGINVVARKFQTQDSATFPFFFVKLINSLNTLSLQQLDEHLEYLKEPWRSPVTQAHGISWWEALLRKTSSAGVKKHSVLEISDAAKQEIASAHFRGALGFDTHWLRLSTQSPWKEMLNEYKWTDVRVGLGVNPATITTANEAYGDDEHEHGLPQSPPHRKKIAGRVPMNRESTRANNGDAERRLWLQQLVVNRKDSHAESSGSSTSSDEDADEDEVGTKLGKRLRTSKG